MHLAAALWEPAWPDNLLVLIRYGEELQGDRAKLQAHIKANVSRVLAQLTNSLTSTDVAVIQKVLEECRAMAEDSAVFTAWETLDQHCDIMKAAPGAGPPPAAAAGPAAPAAFESAIMAPMAAAQAGGGYSAASPPPVPPRRKVVKTTLRFAEMDCTAIERAAAYDGGAAKRKLELELIA